MPFQSINPATEEVLKTYPEDSAEAVERGLSKAQKVFASWSALSFAERGRPMQAIASLLKEKKQKWGRLMSEEMGKPITQAIAEAEKCASACEYFAEHAERLLTPEVIASDATTSYVRFDPLGTILAIMPWNFPFWQVFRCAAPALMAGNVILVKPALNTVGTALAIQTICRDAGLPEGVLQVLLVDVEGIPGIIGDERVRAVTLTGSDRAGAVVAATAGQALKKCVLELGGSDPFIVFGDVDIDKVVEAAAAARTQNSGQSCIAAKRFIVEETIADRFAQALKQKFESMTIGDPLDLTTEIGPLARRDLLDRLHHQVSMSIQEGARLITGGAPLKRKGYFYPPTLLDHVRSTMTACREEVFGPVAALIRVKDDDEAVARANQTPYGLGASLWSRDRRRAEALAPRIEAGQVFINGIVHSDPRLPFGGVKHSGYGRELSAYGMKEFVNIKTVWVR